ncbi:MAG: hypothetical protein K1X88_08710, partial [Nannocystaceae bacterium]|nr:hypothetical protein [Nannocystaceae bacterium]
IPLAVIRPRAAQGGGESAAATDARAAGIAVAAIGAALAITGVALLVVAVRRGRAAGKAAAPSRRGARLRAGPGGFALAW